MVAAVIPAAGQSDRCVSRSFSCSFAIFRPKTLLHPTPRRRRQAVLLQLFQARLAFHRVRPVAAFAMPVIASLCEDCSRSNRMVATVATGLKARKWKYASALSLGGEEPQVFTVRYVEGNSSYSTLPRSSFNTGCDLRVARCALCVWIVRALCIGLPYASCGMIIFIACHAKC